LTCANVSHKHGHAVVGNLKFILAQYETSPKQWGPNTIVDNRHHRPACVLLLQRNGEDFFSLGEKESFEEESSSRCFRDGRIFLVHYYEYGSNNTHINQQQQQHVNFIFVLFSAFLWFLPMRRAGQTKETTKVP
jgi:hypothetical protein